jgi:hypothetical protein
MARMHSEAGANYFRFFDDCAAPGLFLRRHGQVRHVDGLDILVPFTRVTEIPGQSVQDIFDHLPTTAGSDLVHELLNTATSNWDKAIAIHEATGPLRNIRFWRGPEVAGPPEVAEV